MPYVDLVASNDDYASLWYSTNSPTGTVGGFDPNKPVVIMLHPIFLDSSWLYLQLQDPRLNDNYNLIVFDARCAGRTHSRPNGKHDHWTDAADLAFAIQVRFYRTCNCFVASSPRLAVDSVRCVSVYLRVPGPRTRPSGCLPRTYGQASLLRRTLPSASLSCTSRPLLRDPPPSLITIITSVSGLYMRNSFPEMCLSLILLTAPTPTE